MEKNQNLKPTTIKDPIEEIWNANPKIPFMQSKEILKFGFNEGKKSLITEISNVNQSSQPNRDGSFVGTTKELIDHTNKKISQTKDENKKSKPVYINATELDIEEARYKLLNEIIDFMGSKRDLIETYTKINNMCIVSEKRYNKLKAKYKQGNGE